MELNTRVSVALAVACAAAILFIAVRRRRRNRRKTSCCYLEFELKPQSSFKRVLADNSYAPFKHLKLPTSDNAISSNLHPYKADIMMLLKSPEVDYSSLNEVLLMGMSDSYIWIETETQLRKLANELSKEKVIGVDTEQHSLHSFLGFTGLIQISTQKEDYLIDTIALHDVMDIIRPVFSDSTVLKVFHGSDNDVLWLQRDFHIYVVNLFDTAKACEILSKPQKSLAYLLENYCGVIANKLLQREDWRQRPLPEGMLEYARSDAHYLLYIARCLLDELRERDNACQDEKLHFLLEASRRSNNTCLQLYLKEDEAFPGESAASSILSRSLTGQGIGSSKSLEEFQSNVQKLCAWRDLMARVHDESLRYVLSDQAIVALADKSPISETDIYKIISEAEENNDSSPSHVIYSHWEDVQCLLKDGGSTSNDLLQKLLLKRLGPDGTCSLSIYNYGLLSRSNLKLESKSISKANGRKNGRQRQFGRKASRDLFVKKFSCKAPVYDNCRIYASDGRLLCYCDRRKLEWYVSRNLAKLVDENPPAIILSFEPKGRPEDADNDFYIQSKRNMCVGCGERNHYLRYRIIPSCYRVHFPEHLKSHRSHDIVLLCVDCHEIAHASAERYKRQVAKEYGIPLYVKKVVDPGQMQITEVSESHAHEEAGVSPLQLRNAAMALLKHGTKMPPKRCQELIEIVKAYFGGREISHEDLEAALFVGMSPHERRKFVKERALSNESSATSIFAGLVLEDNSDSKTLHVSDHSSKTSEANGTMDTKDQSSTEQRVNKLETDEKNASLSSDFEVIENVSAVDDVSETLGSSQNSEVKDGALSDVESNSEVTNPSNGTAKNASNGSFRCEQRVNKLESDEKNASLSSDFEVIENVSAIDDVSETLGSSQNSEVKDGALSDVESNSEVTNPSNGTANLSITNGNHNSKLSLLGHGPHGKEVVTHILEKHGEDGIREFCQKWRHVFVETVHPRFLPGGWDIKHSGKRDFGEFSVYKPATRPDDTI